MFRFLGGMRGRHHHHHCIYMRIRVHTYRHKRAATGESSSSSPWSSSVAVAVGSTSQLAATRPPHRAREGTIKTVARARARANSKPFPNGDRNKTQTRARELAHENSHLPAVPGEDPAQRCWWLVAGAGADGDGGRRMAFGSRRLCAHHHKTEATAA